MKWLISFGNGLVNIFKVFKVAIGLIFDDILALTCFSIWWYPKSTKLVENKDCLKHNMAKIDKKSFELEINWFKARIEFDFEVKLVNEKYISRATIHIGL